jgi:hypothetical protein
MYHARDIRGKLRLTTEGDRYSSSGRAKFSLIELERRNRQISQDLPDGEYNSAECRNAPVELRELLRAPAPTGWLGTVSTIEYIPFLSA